MRALIALLLGLLFGFGLLLSGMANPAKVLSFLDLTDAWDPSLMLVMGGAISVALPCFALARRRSEALLGGPMQLPQNRRVDRRLLLGSAVFGVGWGLAGICPGPAVAVLLSGHWQPLLFMLAMLSGLFAQRLLASRMP